MTSVPAATPHRSFGALRHGAFRNLWIGLLASNSGTWAQNVAQGWLLYQISNSRLMLGASALAFALPMTTLPLFGGVIADRYDRLKVLRCTQAFAMLLAAILSWLTFTGRVAAWHLIALTFLGAVALAIDNPTRQSLIPALVPREALMSAMALNGIVFTGAGLFGSALAGAVLHGYEGQVSRGAAIVFALNAASFTAVLAPLFFIRAKNKDEKGNKDEDEKDGAKAPPRAAAAKSVPEAGVKNAASKEDAEKVPPASIRRSPSPWEEVREGFAYLRSHHVLALLIALSAIANFFGRSFLPLMPVLARDVLHVGAGGLGTMHSLASAGTLAGGLGLAAVGGARRLRTWLAVGLLMAAVTVMSLAVSHWYAVALLILGINGAVLALTTATIATGIQINLEERMRGRIMSYYTLTLIGIAPLGGGLASVLAQWLSIQYALVLPAAFVLLFLLWAAWRSPAWRDLP